MQRLTQFKLRPPNFNILSFYSLLSCNGLTHTKLDFG